MRQAVSFARRPFAAHAAAIRGLAVRAWVTLALLATLTGPALTQTPQQAVSSPEPIAQAPRLRALDLAPFAGAIAAMTPAREAEIMAMVTTMDLAALNDAMWQGRLTSVELTTFYLARIARHDRTLRAFLELNPAALDEAKAADAAFQDGRLSGPLQGIPVALKDNIETAGPMHTTANSAILLDHVAQADAQIVRRLRAGGAVILGKASLSEFAGAVTAGAPAGGAGAVGGQGMNPYGRFATAGSSSGSGIAVSAVLAHVAVGTETSGSLIAPATANGIVALKPTKGIVPTEGIIPLIAHNDTAGPMGRSVADVAALYAVLGATPAIAADRFSISAFDGVTAGLLAADIASDPAHADVLVRATSTLTALGARLRPAELTDPTGQIPMLALVIGSGLRFEVVPYIRALHPDITTLEDLIRWNAAAPTTRIPFGQTLLEELAQISASMTATDHAQATTDLEAAAIAGLEQAFAAASAEVLVSTDSLHAPFYATAGWPAVTVPLGLNGQGQPIGITLIGRKGTDTRLLALAWAIERASRARVVPPMAE